MTDILTSDSKIPPSESGELIIPEGVTAIDTFAYEDEREITSIHFPAGLARIGAHAFYNCRSLYRIRLESSDTDIGDGAFKNCERLREIEIVRSSDSLKALKSLLYDVHRQVRVRIIYPDGDALLIFPYFLDNFEENTPARIVMHISEGSGTPYRECIYSGDVDYRAYDDLFKTGINLDLYDSAADIALCRLTHPYKLSDTALTAYKMFLCSNVTDIFSNIVTNNDTASLKDLLSLGILDKDRISELISTARLKNSTEVLAILLEHYGERYGKTGSRYEF